MGTAHSVFVPMLHWGIVRCAQSLVRILVYGCRHVLLAWLSFCDFYLLYSMVAFWLRLAACSVFRWFLGHRFVPTLRYVHIAQFLSAFSSGGCVCLSAVSTSVWVSFIVPICICKTYLCWRDVHEVRSWLLARVGSAGSLALIVPGAPVS